MVTSSHELKSYTFLMKMEQDMMLENLSSGQSQMILTRSIGFGLVNMTDQALKIVLASITYNPGDEGNSSAVALEEYLQNDTIYMKMDGNWTALELSGMGDAWSEQNSLDQQVNMLNSSRLTLVGSEKVGDEDCYKLRAEMDVASYADVLSREVASNVPFLPLNSSELFRNMTLEVNYWISKENHLIKRADVFETLFVAPQSLGLLAGEESLAVRISSTTSIVFDGFNESINIVLPPEASSAQLFQMPSYPESEAVAVAVDDGPSAGDLSLLDAGTHNATSRSDIVPSDGLNGTARVDVMPVGDGSLSEEKTSFVILKRQSPEDDAGMRANNTTINTKPVSSLPLPDPRH